MSLLYKVKTIFAKEYETINSGVLFLSVFGFLSLFFSLLRDRLIVAQFGVGVELDVYYAAFKLPDILFSTFVAFVSLFVIVPILSKKQTSAEQEEYLDNLFRSLLAIFVPILIFIFAIIPIYLQMFFKDLYFSEYGRELATLSYMLVFQFVLLAVSQIFISFLQLKRKFIVYASVPILYNLGIILGALFFAPSFGLVGLALGVLLGSLLYFFVSLYFSGLTLRVFKKVRIKELFNLFKESYPRAATLLLQQLFLFAVFVFLAQNSQGALASFQLANNLQSAVLSVLALSFSVASFPFLADLFAKGKDEEFIEKSLATLKNLILVSLFVLPILYILKFELVTVVYKSANFSFEDAAILSQVFGVFLLAGLPQSVSVLLSRVYYAASQIKKAFYIYFASFLVSGVFLVFSQMTHGAQEDKLLLAAWAYFLFNAVSALLFLLFFKKDFKAPFDAWRLPKEYLKFILASLVSFLLIFAYKLIFAIEIKDLSLLYALFVILHVSIAYLALFAIFAKIFRLEFKKLLRILKSQ